MKKIIIISMLCIITITTLIILNITQLGDVNNDKVVDKADIKLVQNHLLQVSKLNRQEIVRADINTDGEITILDLLKIKKIILEEGD